MNNQLVSDFQNCCIGLLSTKVTVRMKNSEKLSEYLCNPNVLQAINNSTSFTWDSVLYYVNAFLLKEAEKLYEDERKKSVSEHTYFKKRTLGDTLLDVAKLANSGEIRLRVSKLIECVEMCFQSKCISKQFSKTYILLLRDRILSENQYWPKITQDEWLRLYNLLKQLILKPLNECEEIYYIECLHLVLKWGPLHSLPGTFLRNEFDFMHELCSKLSDYEKATHEKILQLLIEFCKHTAKDCRMACCKFGEMTFYKVLGLYSTNCLDRVKYFLLQMSLHHPKGASEGSSLALAACWHSWHKQIKSLNELLCDEINRYLSTRIKNYGLFVSVNENKTIHPSFVNLMVEVQRQILVTKETDCEQSTSEENANKRRKVEAGMEVIIDSIQIKRDWPWINITTQLLKRYPKLITCNEFTKLLQVLSEIQVECKDSDMRYHLYECLIVLADVQKHLNTMYLDAVTVDSLWSVIWESTLRAAGLNQNEAQTNKLLQKLIIINYKLRQSSEVFRAYFSGVLRISEHSLSTLEVACCYCPLPETVPQFSTQEIEPAKLTLLKLLLAQENCSSVFSSGIFARVCVSLVLRKFPKYIILTQEYYYKDIDELHEATCIDGGLLVKKAKAENEDDSLNSLVVEKQWLDVLVTLLVNIHNDVIVDTDSTSAKYKLTNIATLCFNVLSYLLRYNIFNSEDLDECVLYKNMLEALGRLANILNGVTARIIKTWDSGLVRDFKQWIQLFEKLFQSNIVLDFSNKLREVIPVDLLHRFFDLLNVETKEENDNAEGIKVAIAEIVTRYCCVPNSPKMSKNQTLALEALIPDGFDAKLNTHYALALMFLSSLSNCELGTLNETLIDLSLSVIENICESRYLCYEAMLKALDALCGLYPHIKFIDSDSLKQKSLGLLQPLYDSRNNLCPEVLVKLQECMGTLTNLDETFSWAKWGYKHVSEELLVFINSDYQTVRLAATKNLVFVFQKPSNVKIQKVIFEKLIEKCDKVFTIESIGGAVLCEERRVDETVTRTASVMHTYGTILAISGVWRRRALLALLRIVHRRNLNTDTLRKTLREVSSYLGFNDSFEFLKNYLTYLIEDWYKMTGSLDEFPFSIFGCSSEREFYNTVLPFVIPLCLQEVELANLNKIASILGANPKELLQQTFADVISACLPLFTKLPVQSQNIKIIYQNALLLIGEEAIEYLLLDKMDQIIVSIVKYVYNSDYFQKILLDVEVVLLEPDCTHYTIEVLQSIFDYLQEKVTNGDSLVSFCVTKRPSFIQQILLHLTDAVYAATVLEEKITAFCRYTVIINETLPFLKSQNPMQVFLVNYTTSSLINIIRNEQECFTPVAVAACNYLKLIFHQILADCAELIENLLVVVVNILVPIAGNVSQIGDCCMNLLNYLIVDNAYVLLKAVKSLDEFPNDARFAKLSEVYYKVKYGNENFTLTQEIQQFLNSVKRTDRNCFRCEGLKHLKKQLASRKGELQELYQSLSEIRGFAEDAQESLLHQLICALVKLSRSENSEVSLEASRCLGELGPADLTTLVLQTDLSVLDFKYTHFELITGKILSVFVEYIVDSDIEVVKATSSALYKVLQSKEGQSVITSKKDYGSGVIDRKLLLPFISAVKTNSASQIQIEEQYFKNRIKSESLWCPERTCSHSEWITDLVCAILDTISHSCYLPSLIPVCKVKVEFSEMLLPLLINLFFYMNNKLYAEIIYQQINYFFERHWNLTTSNGTRCNYKISLTQASVQCMLDVIHFYRIQRSQISVRKNSSSLDVNYLHVARAAQFCSAHFSVLLYIELWAKTQLETIRAAKPYEPFATDVTELDIIYQEQDEHTKKTLHSMLKSAYSAIGENDAIHGCSFSQFFSNEYCKDLGFLELLQYHDIQISHGTTSSVSNLMESLKDCSLYQLPLICKAEANDSRYECLWRLSQWNEKVPYVEFENMHNAFEKLKYFTLKGLHDRDDLMYTKALENARRCVIEDLKCSSLESCKNLYAILCKLQSLQELEDFGDAKNKNMLHLINKWKLQDAISKNEFSYIEPIKAQRITVLRDFLLTNTNTDLKKYLINSHIELAVMGRHENSFNTARRILADLHYLSDLTQEDKYRIIFEEAQLCWESGNKHVGKQMLRQLFSIDTQDKSLQASLLKLYGTWMAEASSQSSHVIIKDYLQKSIEIFSGDDKDIFDTYNVLAQFADKQYQQVLAYTKSTGFERTIQNVERSKHKANGIEKLQKMNEDERRAKIILEKQIKIDENKINSSYREKDKFLLLAVEYYLRNLERSDLHNTSVFRVISLFLENRNNTDLKSLMERYLHRIPSYKYVTILPQLVPHITPKEDDEFGGQVTSIVLRCAKEHPHHTLPLILALINANRDRDYCGSTTKTDSNETRLNGAKYLVERLNKESGMRQLIINMMRVADALIELAYVKCAKLSRNDIDRSSKIRNLRNIENVLLPTVNLPVSKSGNYSGLIGIRSFGDKFISLDGINAPKRITCQGTDGIWRTQLVKGKDDLRQDAVMQQVFTIMNGFLIASKQTKRLLIRTYKIVPLSMRSGILEWVENSIPIGEYLVGEGNSGAHSLYSKSSHYTPSECRKKLQDIAKASNEKKLRVFMDICRNFPPIFHKFFETTFPQPTVWYERRRAYIHSVATSSMCGYILGIGDRHVRNILIDKKTAEVVHIDFGIAFDQAHVLPTPETVPFRLTRDIEDGMGVSGVEGVFRRSCEKTMEVLRQNSQTIITILEVLLYDPLYSWAVTPAEAYNRQKEEVDGNISAVHYSEEDEIPNNVGAERALIRLKEKLQGTEDGSATSVEGQVGKLIQQARNPDNLCRLFNGWQAYL